MFRRQSWLNISATSGSFMTTLSAPQGSTADLQVPEVESILANVLTRLCAAGFSSCWSLCSQSGFTKWRPGVCVGPRFLYIRTDLDALCLCLCCQQVSKPLHLCEVELPGLRTHASINYYIPWPSFIPCSRQLLILPA